MHAQVVVAREAAQKTLFLERLQFMIPPRLIVVIHRVRFPIYRGVRV